MQNADLGMNIGNTVVVRAPVFGDSTSGFRLQTFSEVLLAQPTVDEVLLSVTTPDGGENGWVAGIRRQQADKLTKSAVINVIDRNFFKVFGIGLVAGRDFLPSEYRTWEKFGEQTESVVINVSTVGLLGLDSPETAIDQTFFWGEDRCRVVGVVRDFHQRSLQFEVEPAVFLLDRNGTNFCIRISETITPSDIPAVLTALENAYRQFFPHDPFEYFFLEDRFDLQYHEDRRFSALFSFFSILALFIAWLGLAGLVTFFLLHRRKEIGIRKVLGATVASILGMVSKNYVRLGLISVVIITPFTYYFINRWLEQYAYHISPDWWMFGWPALMVLLSAIIVVICQAMKSALTNPAESLRNE